MSQAITKKKIIFVREFKELFNTSWRNIVFYGGRGSGKSFHVALALIIRARQTKLRILCTREIQNTIGDSVHKLLKDIIEKNGFTDYEVTDKVIRNKRTGSEFIFRGLKHNIMEVKSTEGVDITWIEEAQSISDESLKILIPTIRKDGSQLIFTFNRVNELDPVYVKYVQNMPARTYVRKVNFDVLEKVGLFPEPLQLERDEDKKNPELYAHIWLGEPLSQTDTAIIGRTAILGAMEREIEPDGAIIIAVDVARMGGDRTVLWKRKGLKTLENKVFTKLRTTQVCDQIELFAEFDFKVEIRVDDTGVGGGVTDEMLKRGYNVIPVNFGGVASDEDKYPNWISEAWFHMSEVIGEAQLPYDSDLLMELSTRQWLQDNKGKRRVESKVDYKKRGFRSPDLADACIICYATPKTGGILAWMEQAAEL